jgi:hypothetical protein
LTLLTVRPRSQFFTFFFLQKSQSHGILKYLPTKGRPIGKTDNQLAKHTTAACIRPRLSYGRRRLRQLICGVL